MARLGEVGVADRYAVVSLGWPNGQPSPLLRSTTLRVTPTHNGPSGREPTLATYGRANRMSYNTYAALAYAAVV